ncbi:hypothetical protein An01g11210 [Aspergillus niger]|uniref:Uncharacterized protein n=2 Tax=Aspergillus niger TaxID=5061 RepID=A2QAE5_ASPNC|nr:hypothetical protein An01g11210 [Aspergillus niger]CAK44026.1 hypothetical protein An01g11210 [Aspergillus niger]
MFIDLVLLVMPLPIVVRLQMASRKRIGLVARYEYIAAGGDGADVDAGRPDVFAGWGGTLDHIILSQSLTSMSLKTYMSCQDGRSTIYGFDLSDLKRVVGCWKRWWSETMQEEKAKDQLTAAWLQ